MQIKVLPGFEPGSLDSKSRVITNYTIEPHRQKNGHRGARTPDPGLIRPMLYHLSYATTCDSNIKSASTGIRARVAAATKRSPKPLDYRSTYIAKKKLENPGFDPGASSLRTTHSTD